MYKGLDGSFARRFCTGARAEVDAEVEQWVDVPVLVCL